MKGIFSKCFVCEKELEPQTSSKNEQVNLPVCDRCKGTKSEKLKEAELLDGMADGFVCGCI